MELTAYQWLCNLLNNEYCEVEINTRKNLVVVRLTVVHNTDIFLISRQRTFEACVYDLWQQYRNRTI